MLGSLEAVLLSACRRFGGAARPLLTVDVHAGWSAVALAAAEPDGSLHSCSDNADRSGKPRGAGGGDLQTLLVPERRQTQRQHSASAEERYRREGGDAQTIIDVYTQSENDRQDACANTGKALAQSMRHFKHSAGTA